MKQTKLIVLRGPSGSGKTSTAKAIQEAKGPSIAVVEQDYIRRIMLKEKEAANGLNIQLIQSITLYLLEHSYHVILEGIFYSGRYKRMFEEILTKHPDNNYFFYFDISFPETLRRHASKPNSNDFGEKEMKEWYVEKDFLNLEGVKEHVITEKVNSEQIIECICHVSELTAKK